MRVGIYGGTFDPPHIVHLLLTYEAHETLNLDRVLLIPSGNSYQKESTTSAMDRLAMLAGMKFPSWVRLNALEVSRIGPSFTIDTLRELKDGLCANDELFLILGSDVDLSTWHERECLTDYAEICFFDRRLPVSSTLIRKAIAKEVDVTALLDPTVWEYIQANHLYACDHTKCCRIHNTHTNPHKGCIMR